MDDLSADQKLVERAFRDELTAAEQTTLRERLRGDPELRAFYTRLLEAERGLVARIAGADAIDEDGRSPLEIARGSQQVLQAVGAAQSRARPARAWRAPAAITAAVALAASLLLVVFARPDPIEAPEVVRTRGSAVEAALELRAGCGPELSRSCRIQDRLDVQLIMPPDRDYHAAAVLRAGDVVHRGSATRVRGSASLAGGGWGLEALGLSPGPMTVFVVVSETPLAPGALDAVLAGESLPESVRSEWTRLHLRSE